jgi:polyisoprenoid-binding protein YceI
VLDVTYAGEATDPWGNRRAGFSATTTINRKDFGLTWLLLIAGHSGR